MTPFREALIVAALFYLFLFGLGFGLGYWAGAV